MYHQYYKSKFSLIHPYQAYCLYALAFLRVRQDSSILYILSILTTIIREQGYINMLKKIYYRSTLGLINYYQTFLKITPVTALVTNMFFIHFLDINFTWLIYTRLHCNNNKVIK